MPCTDAAQQWASLCCICGSCGRNTPRPHWVLQALSAALAFMFIFGAFGSVSSLLWQSSPKCCCRRTGVTELQREDNGAQLASVLHIFCESHQLSSLHIEWKKVVFNCRTLVTLSLPYSSLKCPYLGIWSSCDFA